jgi:hypothetical protein
MRPPARHLTLTVLIAAIAFAGLTAVVGPVVLLDDASAAPTSTVAPTTTVASTTTTAVTTTTGVTTTTEAGPPPRASRRVAAPVDIEKIRPTSLPWSTMAFVTAIVIAGLAIAGFIYGRMRSHVPAAATPRPSSASPAGPPTTDPTPAGTSPPLVAPQPMPLPPPRSSPLPPPEPASDWAPPTP